MKYSGNSISIPYSLSYNEGNAVELVINSQITTVNVSSTVTNLPSNILLKKDYPLTFTFTNNNPEHPATQINISGAPSEFVEDTNNVNACRKLENQTLPPKSSCTITGHIHSNQLGSISLPYTFSYLEGAAVETSVNTNVSKVNISGTIQPRLPENIGQNKDYPVIFTFTNNSPVAATHVQTTHVIEDSSFTENVNTCKTLPEQTLDAGQSCNITGIVNAGSKTGSISIPYTLSYLEGADVSLVDNSNIVNVNVEGATLQALPANININTPTPVHFQFKNKSNTEATGITLTQSPSEFTETKNTCANIKTLAAGASCDIEGTYTATIEGTHNTLAYILDYTEGNPIIQQTSTEATAVNIVASTDEILPPVIDKNKIYPIEFKFSNHGSGPANEVTMSAAPEGLSNIIDTCTGTLAAGATCSIKGDYQAPTLGDLAFNYTLSYKEGSDVKLPVITKASLIKITGQTNPTLPTPTILIGKSYPLQFIFTNNNSDLDATEVSMSTAPTGFIATEDTCSNKTTLPKGKQCIIKGNFTATQEGEVSPAYTLSYKGGEAVTTESKSYASKININIVFRDSLPNIINLNQKYFIQLIFKNITVGLSVTDVNIDLPQDTDYIEPVPLHANN